MKVITIFNNKGGVGKTTSAQNIGAALALFADQKTLIIDLDQQANLTMGFGIKIKNKHTNAASFILGETDILETRVKYKNTDIDILPASHELRKQEKRIETEGYPTNFRKKLDQVSNQYDYVVIDCPPNTSVFSDIALVACDQYYVPLQVEYFSYEGLRNLARYIDELRQDKHIKEKVPDLKLELGGVFAVGFNPNAKKNISKAIIQSVKEQLGDKLLSSYIRTSVALSEAQAKGMHIFDLQSNYKRGRKAAEDYHALSEEIFNKCEYENKK